MQEQKDRRMQRLQSMRDCKTTTELALDIWPKALDESTIGDRSHYRLSLINWIEAYRTKTKPQWTAYKTPRELAEGVWWPYLDSDDGLLPDLRDELVEWIENYAKI